MQEVPQIVAKFGTSSQCFPMLSFFASCSNDSIRFGKEKNKHWRKFKYWKGVCGTFSSFLPVYHFFPRKNAENKSMKKIKSEVEDFYRSEWRRKTDKKRKKGKAVTFWRTHTGRTDPYILPPFRGLTKAAGVQFRVGTVTERECIHE